MTNFDNLFVLDLANNHQGEVNHGLKIIHECAKIVKKHEIKAALKFQFRQLDTFVHPKHRKNSDNKHIPRFLSTNLNKDNWQILFDAVKAEGLLTMCTPFDEESVDVIKTMGFDYIKVASCSAKDWPLLEKIASVGMLTIFSTGGLEISDVDNLYSFFEHKGIDFALMHCISIYPTPIEQCNLNHIDTLIRRYPKVVGWSTHEDPNETSPVQIAVAKGARMFERHIGIETDKIKLNSYSSTPKQLEHWFKAYNKSIKCCGSHSQRQVNKTELGSIQSLQRGVFVKKSYKKGFKISKDNVYFAMPYSEGQLSSEDWGEGIELLSDVESNDPLMENLIQLPKKPKYQILKHAVHEVKAMLNEASIILDSSFKIEFSHHYGIENFRETGALIIDCINREYCKKLVVSLPNQKHPNHYHKRKEETFQVLSGIFECVVDGKHRTLKPGETILVQPGVWHSFWSNTGCIIEEISTTHFNNDSIYSDQKINDMNRSERKTQVKNWGRFELVDKVD